MRIAAELTGDVVTNMLVIADGAAGDATIAALGLVDVTGLEVQPGIGWTLVDGVFVAPQPD